MFARLALYENVAFDLTDQVQQWFEARDTDPSRELPGYRGSMTLVDRAAPWSSRSSPPDATTASA